MARNNPGGDSDGRPIPPEVVYMVEYFGFGWLMQEVNGYEPLLQAQGDES
jgi:hypothetical protein